MRLGLVLIAGVLLGQADSPPEPPYLPPPPMVTHGPDPFPGAATTTTLPVVDKLPETS